MPSIRISQLELEALDGLPLAARCAYIFALRPFMDFDDCHVYGVSYRSIAERLYVEPVQGRHRNAAGAPTKKAIRHSIECLEVAGLLLNRSVAKSLIFYLPLAARDQSVRNMRGTSGAHRRGTPSPTVENEQSGFEYSDLSPQSQGQETPMRGTPETPMRGTYPVSGSGCNRYTRSIRSVGSTTTQDGFGLTEALQLLVDWGMPQKFGMNLEDRKLVSRWMQDGVTREQLNQACERAALYKKSRNDRVPIGPRYIDRVLETLRGNSATSGQAGQSGHRKLSAAEKAEQAERSFIDGEQRGSSDPGHGPEKGEADHGQDLDADDAGTRPPLDGQFRRLSNE